MISRVDEILSHMMNKNIITLTNEIVDPIGEIIDRRLRKIAETGPYLSSLADFTQ
jgi:hypothetical protein